MLNNVVDDLNTLNGMNSSLNNNKINPRIILKQHDISQQHKDEKEEDEEEEEDQDVSVGILPRTHQDPLYNDEEDQNVSHHHHHHHQTQQQQQSLPSITTGLSPYRTLSPQPPQPPQQQLSHDAPTTHQERMCLKCPRTESEAVLYICTNCSAVFCVAHVPSDAEERAPKGNLVYYTCKDCSKTRQLTQGDPNQSKKRKRGQYEDTYGVDGAYEDDRPSKQSASVKQTPSQLIQARVKWVIQNFGLLQKDLAEQLSVSSSTVSTYMTSKPRKNGWFLFEQKLRSWLLKVDVIKDVQNQSGGPLMNGGSLDTGSSLTGNPGLQQLSSTYATEANTSIGGRIGDSATQNSSQGFSTVTPTPYYFAPTSIRNYVHYPITHVYKDYAHANTMSSSGDSNGLMNGNSGKPNQVSSGFSQVPVSRLSTGYFPTYAVHPVPTRRGGANDYYQTTTTASRYSGSAPTGGGTWSTPNSSNNQQNGSHNQVSGSGGGGNGGNSNFLSSW